MHSRLPALVLVLILSGVTTPTFAVPAVVFPKAGELHSPDGRFLVRNADREAPSTDFVGTFHSLWLVEVASGNSRKLCDYVGVAAVRWSDNDHLVITEYVGKKSSRALMFSAGQAEGPVMLDKAAVIGLIPPQSRAILRENDHVFVEAVGVQQGTLALTVWGNGQGDQHGFRWNCSYDLRDRSMLCKEERISHQNLR